MTTQSHFPHPDRAEAITPAWLSGVLGESLPGVEVAGVKVLDRHSGTTGRARLGIEYASGESGPLTLFVKLPPFGEEQRQLVAATDMGRREARFYESLAGETPVRVPRPYFAAHGDERTQYIMILEDLEASGCVFPRDVDAYARDHGKQVIDALARLHAHFWEDGRFDTELSWLPPAMRGALGAQLIDTAREKFGKELPPVFSELCRLYVEHHEAVCDLWDEGPRTLIHGDIHSGNQFVDGDGIGFYDWAVISRSPGIRDVGIFLCNSCSPEVRRAEGEGWVRGYHQGLVDAGVDAPDFDELWLRFRRAVLYGWIAATATAAVGDRWQPIEVGMSAMRRSTEACADLETLEAFREVL
jgi:aminoglycoside phosphotransferase (APT) family kinase protein